MKKVELSHKSENMLKILHTADWHLGHRLHGLSRKYEHECFLSWLLAQIEQTRADALIIAGDIFDSANPPASAQAVFYDFLVKARKCNQTLDIIIIGGNHDSASRLDAPSQILQSLGIRIIGGLTHLDDGGIDWQRLLIPLTNQSGEISAICGAMPFIRNADLPQMNGQEFSESNDPLIQGVSELYQQLFAQIQEYRIKLQLDDSVGQIVTGHCYMVGTTLSELSERRILGGNQHALPASIFNEKIDYVALGHLHKAQQVTNTIKNAAKKTKGALIRYSGSPIPLSFTERNYKHQISQIILDVNATSKTENERLQVQAISIPRAVLIKSIPEHGYVKLAELEVHIAALNLKNKEHDNEISDNEISDLEKHGENNTGDKKTGANYPMLEIRVELDKPEPGLRQQIETMLDGLAVRLLKISVHYPGKGEALADNKQQIRLEELHPEDVFQQCYQRAFEQQAPENITELFHQLLESVEEKV